MADKEITDNIGNISVLQMNNEIIGSYIWKENLLHLIMIAPDHQGSGDASYFIDNMSLKNLQKYDEILLECFENNIQANGFYKKNSWLMYDTQFDTNLGLYRLFYKKTKK